MTSPTDNPYESTTFLNVDLDISSRVSLEPLVSALGKKVFVHYVGKHNGKFWAHLSRSSYGQSADKLARELCSLVRRLPRGPRKLWNNAVSREFNVGVQAGNTPYSHEVRIAEETLSMIVELGGTIVVTTYAPITAETDPKVPPNDRMQLTAPLGGRAGNGVVDAAASRSPSGERRRRRGSEGCADQAWRCDDRSSDLP